MGEEIALDHQPKGWPYEEGRLKQIDYQAIIDAEQPWTDPDFMPDSESLFINGSSHRNAKKFKKKAVWETYEWIRISDYFGPDNFVLWDSIEPEDIKMGNIENQGLMATLSGLAERDIHTQKNKKKLTESQIF